MKKAEKVRHPFGVSVHCLCLSQAPDGIHIRKESCDLSQWQKDGTIHFDPFTLSTENSKAEIRYHYDLHHGALPERHKYDPAISRYVPLHEVAFELEPGDYGQAVCNGRFVDWDTGDWWYEMDILNIILLPESIPEPTAPPDCFLARKPNKNYRQVAQLW